MIAFVRDCELHVLYVLYNEERKLTSGAAENGMVSFMSIDASCDLHFPLSGSICS